MQAFYNNLSKAPTSWLAQFTSLTEAQIDDLKKEGRDWLLWVE